MSPASTDVVARLQAAFEPHRDLERAAAMSAYMRNLFPFLGVPSPQRSALEREALTGVPRLSAEDASDAALALWLLPEREYQYAACGLLARNAKALGPEFLPVARRLVQSKSWWDTVDTLASHVVGGIVLGHPELRAEMDRWIEDEDFWVARVALLHQLRHKKATDAARLFAYCERRSADPEFFIRKAIGWALREYSKTDAAAVKSFVASHERALSNLSRREALLWLNGGRKKQNSA
jgi:3-methyladenine DNA glycosylase AlkD